MGRIEKICVYCSSSSHVERIFFDAAVELGVAIAERAGTLVFGGNACGMMKTVADAVRENGGTVVGITPQRMVDHGIGYHDAHELIVTEDMASRKSGMIARADAFVALPGGFGTLEELTEVLTLKHLGYHQEPIVLLNIAGFYDPLIELFEHFFEHHFAKTRYRDHYFLAETVAAAMDFLTKYETPIGETHQGETCT